MSSQSEPADAHDHDKRRQIIGGAREVFRAKGYEGAAMDAIAKAAGVSKGTLYVYFANKDELFETLITEERRALADALERLKPQGETFRENLRQFAIDFCGLLTAEGHMSAIRMVIGAVEKFPQVGAMFFSYGAEHGVTRLSEVFGRAVEQKLIKPCDPTKAAQHFIALCTSEAIKKALFGVRVQLSSDEAEAVIDSGLDVFWTYYTP